MRYLLFVLSLPILLSSKTFSFQVPSENLKKGELPSLEKSEKMARDIVMAIQQAKPDLAKEHFFPEQVFNELKNIPYANRYYEKLMTWYINDLQREHESNKDSQLIFVKLKKGYCKWKEVGSEYNHIAYWSCYRNAIEVKDQKTQKVFDIPLKSMINWGDRWYVTHLGPIPKQ